MARPGPRLPRFCHLQTSTGRSLARVNGYWLLGPRERQLSLQRDIVRPLCRHQNTSAWQLPQRHFLHKRSTSISNKHFGRYSRHSLITKVTVIRVGHGPLFPDPIQKKGSRPDPTRPVSNHNCGSKSLNVPSGVLQDVTHNRNVKYCISIKP